MRKKTEEREADEGMNNIKRRKKPKTIERLENNES